MPSQITFITKRHPESSLEAIRRVGGVRVDGERFNIPRQECADDILNGIESYCVMVYGVQVGVTAYEKNGEKFIRTKPNKNQTDNLLSLDEC
jgi:Protein of unknown function (DUF3892)